MSELDYRTLERFWEKVVYDHNSGCINWDAATQEDGYGQFRVREDGKWVVRKAHRVIWAHYEGAIPEGHKLRRSCKSRACVNPNHMYLQMMVI